jgi:dipeptidyl aminopeptidase/acylaminoacyl peptidase
MCKYRAHFLMTLILPAAAMAQDTRPVMSIVDALNVPQMSSPHLSPDGESLVFEVAEADWKKNKQVTHLWLQRGNADPVQITYGVEDETDPAWSPDGQHLAFLSKRGEDEETQVFLLPTAGGEARRLTSHDASVGDVSWAPDSSAIYFLAEDPETEEEKKKEKLKDDVFMFDEDKKHKHLWRQSLDAEEATRLTEGDFTIRAYELSRDGEQIVVQRAPTPLLNSIFEAELHLIDANGEDWRRLTDNDDSESSPEISPNGDSVLYISDVNAAGDPYYNGNLFVVSADGGDPQMLLQDAPWEIDNASWSDNGRSIYFVANTGVRSNLYEVDLDSERVSQVTEGDHALFGWEYLPDIDQHIAGISTPDNPGEVWRIRNGRSSRLTSLYEDLSSEFFLPRQEAVTWAGDDGTMVEGLIYYPKDYEEGKRYPLAVQTHGGPAASDKFRYPGWGSYMQILAGRGWLVFRPNYRGSVGYGDEFLRDMVDHYFNQAHLDVMTGVDHLIERGLADPDRMIKMGWSGGGHMTNKIITFTDRFKAAASGAGAANWVSMYGQTDIRIHRENWFGGSPWAENASIEKFWEQSALSSIWKVKTPTIVLVGQNDERVPATQSVELYRALKANGVDTHLYMAPREPHGWRELRHRLFKVNIELEWFERHALGQEYVWEEAPEVEDDEEEDE